MSHRAPYPNREKGDRHGAESRILRLSHTGAPSQSGFSIVRHWLAAWGGLLVALAGATSFAAEVAADAVHPSHALVPAFERFYGESQTDSAADQAPGGMVLLGELNCTSCHIAGKQVEGKLLRKQAPLLDQVGNRVRASYLKKFIADPQTVKPGTTMPNLLDGLSDDQKQEQLDAVVHYLASTGNVAEKRPAAKQIAAGKSAYHQLGCVACHGARGPHATALATSVPLGALSTKYSLPSLTDFLNDPLKVRPSGRMPAFAFAGTQAADIANFLLADLAVSELDKNLTYFYYEPDTELTSLPDLTALEPKATGTCSGFDLQVAKRENNYVLRFRGFLRVNSPGEFEFFLTSDDGSRLSIDGQEVINHDGVHGAQMQSGKATLARGARPFEVTMFNGGGGAHLQVEVSTGGRARQSIVPFLALTADPPKPLPAPRKDAAMTIDPVLAAKGRKLFGTLGCAACHPSKDGPQAQVEELIAPGLMEMKATGGCLAEQPTNAVPHYAFSRPQRQALTKALQGLARPVAPAALVEQTLLALNCYACHNRDGRGGVEDARNEFFETTQKEMGDEGRLPPTLSGVGAKLNTAWLKKIFTEGAKDRPYMLTQMPRFGDNNLGHLTAALETIDTIEPVATPKFSEPERRVKAAGRLMVGDKGGLGCVKCHNFGEIPSSGIQALNMTLMTQRLKHDWFHRYIANPQVLRPGTRMPAAWPNGQTFFKNVLDGNVDAQIEAVWLFLSDGSRAATPQGLSRESLELRPETSAVIYRNFIEGAGPRAIGVGYPEQAHLAFDANNLRLALIWQGAFIDASRHWNDRGAGFQPPLGDNVVKLPEGVSFATLKSPDEAWPKQTAKELGYRFRGYRLTPDDKPTFLYELGAVRVEDFFQALASEPNPSLRRTLSVSTSGAAPDLFYRAGAGSKITKAANGWYEIEGQFRTRIESSVEPAIRSSDNRQELLVPVRFDNQQAKIVQEFAW